MRKLTVCGACGGHVYEGSQCPTMVTCPLCGAAPGEECKRPLGNDAANMHASRWQEAERLDRQRGIGCPRGRQLD